MSAGRSILSSIAAAPLTRAAVLLFLVSLAMATLQSVFPGPRVGLLVVFFYAICVIFCLAVMLLMVVASAVTGRWKSLARRLVSLAAITVAVLAGGRWGDYVHLAVMYPHYRGEIAWTSKRPLRFYWGDDAVTVLDGIRMRTLVYDDTGATAGTSSPERGEDGLCIRRHRLMASFFIEYMSSDRC